MIKLTCHQCHTVFDSRRRDRKYCSTECSHAAQALAYRSEGSARWKGGAPVWTCAFCEQTFTRYISANSKPPMFCSRSCMAANFKEQRIGENNSSWRGGKWPFKGTGWDDIAAQVIGRDGACRYCGGNDRLVAHHLIPQRFWLTLEQSNHLDNLVACCHSCHVKRPEHFWAEIPDALFDPAIHSKGAMPRTAKRKFRVPGPGICEYCGHPTKNSHNKCCSRSCANKLKWKLGNMKSAMEKRSQRAAERLTPCLYCGKTVSKLGNKCCSASCASKLRWASGAMDGVPAKRLKTLGRVPHPSCSVVIGAPPDALPGIARA